MSTMVLRTRGPAKLPDGYKLAMHISQGDAESIRVFRPRSADIKSTTFGEESLNKISFFNLFDSQDNFLVILSWFAS